MRFRYWVVLVGIVIVAAAAGTWLALGRPTPDAMLANLPFGGEREAAKPEPKQTVTTVPSTREAVPVAFEYTGTIISQKDAELQARVTGVVTERPFEPGGAVSKDALLFQIDKRPFEIALKSAQAQKSQAQAQLTFAKAQVGRATTLTKRGYETEQRAQQLVSQEATANASLEQAEAAIAREQLNIDYSTIRAPFDGRVSLSLINVGDTVIADQTNLASVVQIDPIDVQVALSAQDAEAVRKSMTKGEARVLLLDDNGKVVRDATIYQLDNRFDPRTARRLVRAKINNNDGAYLPGQFVRTRIETGTEQRILVPTVALATQLDQQIVYAVDPKGIVRVLPVETGDAFGDKTAITKGLEPGTAVAVDHLQRLHQGLKVDPKGTDDRSASRQ